MNNDDYFSLENQMKYTGSSQIKDFIKCESCAMAKLKGEWIEETSTALLQSSYIDEYFSGTLDKFKVEHPEMFKKDGALKAEYAGLDDIIKQAENDKMFKKDGALKAEYAGLDDIIKQAENDKMFNKYLSGKHQEIMTGEITGVPVKIKIDSYFENKCIVDLKAIKNLDLLWDENEHCKKNFIDYYDYVLQGALYQEIVRQNTGKTLPFIIAVMTKEKYSERALLQIPQEIMYDKLMEITPIIRHIQNLKEGIEVPIGCGKCDYCKSLKKTEKIYYYNDYFDMKGGI